MLVRHVIDCGGTFFSTSHLEDVNRVVALGFLASSALGTAAGQPWSGPLCRRIVSGYHSLVRRCIEQLQPPPKYATVGMLSQIFDLFASAEGVQHFVDSSGTSGAERVMNKEEVDIILAILTPSGRIKRLSNQHISALPSILHRLVSNPPPPPGAASRDGETVLDLQPPNKVLANWLAAVRKDMKRRCSVKRSTTSCNETPSEEERMLFEAYATN